MHKAQIHYTTVIRKGKIVWKHRPYCLYFSLNLKYLGWSYRAYIKTAKNGGFCQELISQNYFEAVSAFFCCYDTGANASKAVQKIAKDQREYHKCSLCVIIFWIAKIYLSISSMIVEVIRTNFRLLIFFYKKILQA